MPNSTENSLKSSIINTDEIDRTSDIMNVVEPVSLIYKCQICHLALKSNAEFKYHKMFHLSPERHACRNIDIINFCIQEDRTKSIHCSVCDKILFSEEELEKHVKNVTHRKWLDLLQCCKPFLHNNVAQRLISLNMSDSSTTVVSFTKSFYCYVCEVETLNPDNPKVLTEHYISKKHRNQMSQLMENEKFKSTSISENCFPVYICFICNTEFTEEKILYDHYNSLVHQYRAKVLYECTSNKYVNILQESTKNTNLKCTLCNTEATGPYPMIAHIFGSKHRNNISMLRARQTAPHLLLDSENKNQFFCYICETNVPDFMLIQHLKSNIHMKLNKKINHVSASARNKLFLCKTCEKSFSTDLQLIEHFRDREHQDCDKAKISNKNETKIMDSKSLENTSTPENVNRNRFSDDLNEPNKIGLVQDKLVLDSESQNQDNSFLYKKIKLRRPKKIFKSAEIGEKFIELCIESNSRNIYNLDANSMYKMRLGINLSLGTKPERRYCIPCDMEMSSDLQILNQHLNDENHKRNILDMVAKDKPHSSNLNDYLNDFRLSCSYMSKTSKNTVLCFACSIEIEDLNTSIYDHMKSKAHVDNCMPLQASSEEIFQNLTKIWQNTWYFAEKLVCNICSVKCDSEINFTQHLMEDQHLENENQASIEGDVLKTFLCVHCATYYWCSKDNFIHHCNDSLHKRAVECQDNVVPSLPIESIQGEFNNLKDTINSLLRDSDKINQDSEKSMLKLLETIAQKRYPAVKAYLFGSRFSRTNLDDNNDLEIYLDCDNTYHDRTSAEESRERLLKIEKCLKKHEKIWSIKDVNLTAKIPTIRLQFKATNLFCNIQCNDGLNVEKSKLIRFFVESYPACRELILFLNKWLSLCGLSGTRGITDYAVSMLVIFYLQREYILPSISYLIGQRNQSNIVSGWETGFFVEKISLPEQKYALKDHLSGFFDFYAEFNYITDVICPFLGRAAQRRDFVNFDKLPEEMNIYKSLYKSKNAEIFRFDSPMCVQDPIELSENVTTVVTKMQLRMFRQYCLKSRKMLDSLDQLVK